MRVALMVLILFACSSVTEAGLIFHRGSKTVVRSSKNGVRAVCRSGACQVR